MKSPFITRIVLLGIAMQSALAASVAGVGVGPFQEEVSREFTAADGLPSADVRSIAIAVTGDVYAATALGLARFSAGHWSVVAAQGAAVEQVAVAGDDIAYISAGRLLHLRAAAINLPAVHVNRLTIAGNDTFLATDAGLYILKGKKFTFDLKLKKLLGSETAVRQVAVASDGWVAVAAMAGLFLKPAGGAWAAVFPRNAVRSWAPYDVRGVAFDSKNRLWFASAQGVGCQDAEWRLYTGADGLPYSDFTALAVDKTGSVWFGTRMGAIRYDGKDWEYRQGRRWLPRDEVRSIAVNANGDAWIATAAGVGAIERRSMTLAEKAKFFEDEIAKRHLRTPYGYVNEVTLKRPGDTSEWVQHDSDNDGLWTAMYGAGECFDYAATRDPQAKQRAKAVFEALRFLRAVTQGGAHPAPPGFIARAILPASGPDPNLQDSPQRDEQKRATQDTLWKIIIPRWPKSADGQWYWKSDASSDELDGHFFFYALYYDLVADTDDERQRVREQVRAIAEHLLDHNFQLIDHDGQPTRWAVFNPENLNQNFAWRGGRGTNSLSIVNYMKVAAHITGDARFSAAARWLVQQHDYAANILIPKSDTGPGSGNLSDDEMIFMNFYNLIRYETDPILRETYALALDRHWNLERPELNPLFNFIYAASCAGQTAKGAFEEHDLSPRNNEWLTDSVDTLERFPLDRVNWPLVNSHRLDVVRLPDYVDLDRSTRAAGYRVNGKVLPIDERWVGHWNHDPWELDEGGDGRTLGDGEAFLLPYYMGLYHHFLLP